MSDPTSFTFPQVAAPLDVTRVSYVHDQGPPSTTWVINHNLGFYPNCIVIDSGGTEVEGDPTYVDENTLQIDFTYAFGGKAYLS